jgi:hypothetical protein
MTTIATKTSVAPIAIGSHLRFCSSAAGEAKGCGFSASFMQKLYLRVSLMLARNRKRATSGRLPVALTLRVVRGSSPSEYRCS